MKYCPHCDSVVRTWLTMFDELVCLDCDRIIAFLDDDE